MRLTTPTPIGSGSPPVGEARAAGASVKSVKARVRLRATCLDMVFPFAAQICAAMEPMEHGQTFGLFVWLAAHTPRKHSALFICLFS